MKYNTYKICREIIEYYQLGEFAEWIGDTDIYNYLDEHYIDMPLNERLLVLNEMTDFVEYIDLYRSVTDDKD